jgi:hypothetical protein
MSVNGVISIHPHEPFREEIVQGRVDFVRRHGTSDQLETSQAAAAAAGALCLQVVSQYGVLLDPLGDRSVATVSQAHCFTRIGMFFCSDQSRVLGGMYGLLGNSLVSGSATVEYPPHAGARRVIVGEHLHL